MIMLMQKLGVTLLRTPALAEVEAVAAMTIQAAPVALEGQA